MTDLNPDSSAKKPALLRKGKYVFIDDLQEEQHNGSSIPYFSAKAIMMIEKDGQISGDIAAVNVSDLILKQSTYVDAHGKAIEAHKLYIWPRNLGSTAAWTASKREFLTEFILNFPIEIISLQPENGLTWRYITPEAFKKIPADIEASAAFSGYATHQQEYFFLRQPVSTPK